MGAETNNTIGLLPMSYGVMCAEINLISHDDGFYSVIISEGVR
jgi:hypothetical protein